MSTEYRSKGPELLVDLIDKTAAVLVEKAGLDPDTAHLCAEAVAHRMRQSWGGQQVYFPKGHAVDISERDMQLFREFDGRNQRDLAKKYGMSLQWVYQRIKAVQAAETARRQANLFSE
ncbi:MAG TPA: DNA-binding protein [Candidatus Tenderia electrophaga]|uniref:DNA-binding protein n=1 Tax=Candidatus Tenderia electrophaga TaxID=1748243 RepID=A0A832J856_9GAMM|nr:DNA-binding protein [Candidatus Tenderia electrophaga]